MIIAGTGAGLLELFFIAPVPASIYGCGAVFIFCYCMSGFFNLLAPLKKNAKVQALVIAWKKFWTPAKIVAACAIGAIILAFHFWEFPIFGKPLPYVIVGHSRSGRIPPYEETVSIGVDLAQTNATPADLAATCAAAARYFSENYGLPTVRISIYDYLPEIQKMDQCFIPLAHCRYAPYGQYLFEEDKGLKPGWSHFEVARDVPVKTIRECNKVIPGADLRNFPTEKRERLGVWKYRKLYPGFISVVDGLLTSDLCEKPASDPNQWLFPVSRKKMIDDYESLFNELKEIGMKSNFPHCYQNGCDDKAYKAWVRHKYMLWKKRDGSFAPEINACNQTLDEYARACARSEHEKAAPLAAKMEKLLAALKAVKVCGKEVGR